MSAEATYNPIDPTVPNVVTGWSPSIDSPTGNPNTINNPDTSQVGGNVVPYACTVNVASHAIVPFTAQQQAAWSSAQATAQNLIERAAAQFILNSSTELGKLERATADVLIGEINAIREWIVSFKVAVAGAGTLAALKTAVAALPDMPDRTLAQAKTAISNEIAAGTEGD